MKRHSVHSAIALTALLGVALTLSSEQADAAPKPGRTFQDCATCPEMVVVPAGSFVMGSPDSELGRDKDEGQHKVTIGYSFAVSKYTVTWDQWEACVRDAMCDGMAVEAALRTGLDGKPTKNYADHGRGKRPVVGVSWYDAQVFVGWLNKKTGKEKYRLLSEAEYEYAARAGSTTAFPWGDKANHDHANYGSDDESKLGGGTGGRDTWLNETSPVGSFPANAFGLHDMHGNVFQWIEDCYQEDPALLPNDGSAVKTGKCATRGFRSNSFTSNPHTLRSANRAFPYPPNTRGRNYLSIRVAKTLD
jgi:formylglycine-generating enzyme required for sulfatase activity